jgi:hypothetical protein
MHYTKAMEPERVGSPDTHLLILLGREREWVSDAAMPTVGSNLARHGQSVMGSKPAAAAKAATWGLKSSQKYLKFSDQPIWLSLSVG